MNDKIPQFKPAQALLELGPNFYDVVKPASFPKAQLRFWNESAAAKLGLDRASSADYFCHFKALPNNLPETVAMRYHGHQFHHYNPDLGDGRGFSFAQFEKSMDAEGLGHLLEFGTKGSGQTPYSRNGDGRLTLKGAYREALATTYLEALGVKTSKTFCFFETGESLHRHDEPSPTRAAVLTRLSHSHIRFGSFQRLAFLNDPAGIEKLLLYCLKWIHPEIQVQNPEADLDQLCVLFFRNVMLRHADLVASYMIAGFVHGVLNTDNMNISGESFDYGPYRFLPYYDPSFTAAYFDSQGLYCFGRQPISILWNLSRLGESLQVRFPSLPVQEVLEGFSDEFNHSVQKRFLARLNLQAHESEVKNQELLAKFFQMQENSKAGYSEVFNDFHSGMDNQIWNQSPRMNIYQSSAGQEFLKLLREFKPKNEQLAQLVSEGKIQCESLYIDEIEDIWKKIADQDDWSAFEKKISNLNLLIAYSAR